MTHAVDSLVYAQDRVAVLVRTGSLLYGTNISDTPDLDEMGVYVEDRDTFFNTDPYARRRTQVQYRSAGTNEQGQDNKSAPGDVDGTLFSLNAFMAENAKGNPNTITILAAPKDKVLQRRPLSLWYELSGHYDRFISKAMGQRYLGYLKNQRKLYLTGPGADRHRFDLVQQHGFDTKGAYHALRVAIQGCELMEHGRLELPMAPIHQIYLKRVRRGEFSKANVLEHLGDLEARLEDAIRHSQWPDTPDYQALTQWNYELHKIYWAYRERLPHSSGLTL